MPTITFENEEYRAYNHKYFVSQSGKVLRAGRFYNQPVRHRRMPSGYLVVGRNNLVHRMVATCWLEKPTLAKHVHHIDHDKAHNHASNLEWVTAKTHMAERHKGEIGRHVVSDEAKAKLRAYRLGRTTSEETKQKQREANLRLGIKPPRPVPGYKHSPLAIDAMRKNSPNAAACEINGTRYRSFSEAGRALGMKPHTLRKRCLSGSFSGYRVLKSD